MATFDDILNRARPDHETLPDGPIKDRLEGAGVLVAGHVVRDWRLRNSIPPEYWNAFVAAGLATLDELADAAEARKLPDVAAQRQSAAA